MISLVSGMLMKASVSAKLAMNFKKWCKHLEHQAETEIPRQEGANSLETVYFLETPSNVKQLAFIVSSSFYMSEYFH